MRYAIVGSRNFHNYELVKEVMSKYQCTTIVSGGAPGADALGKRYAQEFNKEYIEFPADWKKYPRIAGVIRNKDIVKNSDVVIAFWDGESRGTANSVYHAKRLKKELHIINYKDIK